MLRLIAADQENSRGKQSKAIEATEPDTVAVSDGNDAAAESGQLKADESLRPGYHDPDNYWRNVWLYEQRKAGKSNADIRSGLAHHPAKFETLITDNAVRSAIDSIASYHKWPPLKGKPGRPRA
jgi:hypothetical protein